jgi:hypothetical protein
LILKYEGKKEKKKKNLFLIAPIIPPIYIPSVGGHQDQAKANAAISSFSFGSTARVARRKRTTKSHQIFKIAWIPNLPQLQ